MSWQNQHRPQKIADLHLSSVRKTMQKYLSAGKLPAVMLFAGPKGTGKTSTARIIAALLNSPANAEIIDQVFLKKSPSAKNNQPLTFAEPELTDPQIVKIFSGQSFLVQEIDAASNSRVEDIRQLQDQIFLPPSMSQVSVFIFDEVHMLSTAAFNALLKTLEEPPAHCIFILATTEKHKIPATVISRCSVIEFQKATTEELVTAFNRVLKTEKVAAEPEALNLIAQAADGSFRDGIKLLEMAAVNGQVTVESATSILHGNIQIQLEELLDLIVFQKNATKISQFFGELRQAGVDEQFFLKSWVNFLYHQLQINLKVTDTQEKPLINLKVAHFLLQETGLFKANDRSVMPFLNLELKCLELVMKSSGGAASGSSGGAGVGGSGASSKNNPGSHGGAKSSSSSVKTATATTITQHNFTEQSKNEPILQVEKNSFSGSSADEVKSKTQLSPQVEQTSDLVSQRWRELVRGVVNQSSYLGSIFQLSQIEIETESKLTIGVGSSFHADILKQPKNTNLLNQVMVEIGLPAKKIEFVILEKKLDSNLSGQNADLNQVGQAAAEKNNQTGYQQLQSEQNVTHPAEVAAILESLT